MNSLDASAVDTTQVTSVEETLAWAYRRTVAADLDGDGQAERLVLSADVESDASGGAIWEDGHRWAAYVEEPNARTLLYAGFVPNGHVEAAISAVGADSLRTVVILERTPARLRALEVAYEAPWRARLRTEALFPLEQWLPGRDALP